MRKYYEALESFYASSAGFYRRKALAGLAVRSMEEKDAARAQSLFLKYLDEFPQANDAWVAALHIGQCEEALKRPQAARATYRSAAARYRSQPLARVLGFAYAASMAAQNGDVRAALADYRSALAAWDDDYVSVYDYRSTISLYARLPVDALDPWLIPGVWEVSKSALEKRISQLERYSRLTAGSALTRGRWLIDRQRWDDAILTLGSAVRSSSAASSSEAAALMRRARVARALDMIDFKNATSEDEGKAVAELTAVSAEPFDFSVAVAKVSLASVPFERQRAVDSHALMFEALSAWRDYDRRNRSTKPRTAIDRDAIAVRDALFSSGQSKLFGQEDRWNVQGYRGPRRFVVLRPTLQVILADGRTVEASADEAIPGVENVLFLDDERRALLQRALSKAGVVVWMNFLPPRGGGGRTTPDIWQLDFLDIERTRAKVIFGAVGTSPIVLMEKVNGSWVLTKFLTQISY